MSESKARGTTSLRFISMFMVLYSLLTLILSLIALTIGITVLVVGLMGTDPLALGVGLTSTALYGLAAATLMLASLQKINARHVDATKYTRVAMVVAIPGSLFVALAGAVMVVVGSAAGTALGVVLIVAAALTLWVFARTLIGDLDALLWGEEASRRGFADDLNFVE